MKNIKRDKCIKILLKAVLSLLLLTIAIPAFSDLKPLLKEMPIGHTDDDDVELYLGCMNELKLAEANFEWANSVCEELLDGLSDELINTAKERAKNKYFNVSGEASGDSNSPKKDPLTASGNLYYDTESILLRPRPNSRRNNENSQNENDRASENDGSSDAENNSKKDELGLEMTAQGNVFYGTQSVKNRNINLKDLPIAKKDLSSLGLVQDYWESLDNKSLASLVSEHKGSILLSATGLAIAAKNKPNIFRFGLQFISKLKVVPLVGGLASAGLAVADSEITSELCIYSNIYEIISILNEHDLQNCLKSSPKYSRAFDSLVAIINK